MVHEITIVGGGFGGVRIAKMLARWGRDIHITIIDKERYHTFHPDLYEAATADLPEAFGHLPLEFYKLRSTAAYPLADIFTYDLNVTVLQDEVTGAYFDKNEILLKSDGLRHYDILVLGVGSETNYFNIPGFAERGMPLKNLWDALSVRNALDELFARTSKNERITIVIGGGGFTGCEFVGELSFYVRDLAIRHGHAPDMIQITLIEGSQSLLPGVDRWVQTKAQARLARLGVTMMFNQPIQAVDEKKVVLKDGSSVPFDLLVWTAGVKANSLVHAFFDMTLAKNLCMIVDASLRIAPYDNVFGVGDMTYCVDETTGKSLPMTATIALREGMCIAENIKRTLNKQSLVKYHPTHPGFIIPLGGKYAIIELHHFHMAGVIPWIIKNLVTLHYWIGIIGFKKALPMWWKGAKLFVSNEKHIK